MHIVLEHTTGPKAGLFEIIGRLDDIDPNNPALTVAELPTLSEHLGASLVAVKRTYVLYRGLMVPSVTNKYFNPAQQ